MISVLWQFRRYYGYAVLLLACGWLWLSKNNTEKDLYKARADYAQLEAIVKVQNEQIAALELRSATQREMAEREMAAAKKINAGHQSKAQRILGTSLKGDECSAALQLLKEYGR